MSFPAELPPWDELEEAQKCQPAGLPQKPGTATSRSPTSNFLALLELLGDDGGSSFPDVSLSDLDGGSPLTPSHCFFLNVMFYPKLVFLMLATH